MYEALVGFGSWVVVVEAVDYLISNLVGNPVGDPVGNPVTGNVTVG